MVFDRQRSKLNSFVCLGVGVQMLNGAARRDSPLGREQLGCKQQTPCRSRALAHNPLTGCTVLVRLLRLPTCLVGDSGGSLAEQAHSPWGRCERAILCLGLNVIMFALCLKAVSGPSDGEPSGHSQIESTNLRNSKSDSGGAPLLGELLS